MARTVRNPMETRTPVRTISSVMRNAPRQQFAPRPLDIGFDRGQDDFGGRRTPINQAVTSVIQPSGGRQSTVRQPAGGTSAVAPVTPSGAGKTVAPITSGGSKPAKTVAKPVEAKTSSTKTAGTAKPTTGKTTAAVKPITSTTTKTPTSPVKPITSTTTKTTPKTPVAPVKPITSTTTKTPTSPVKPITSPTTKTTGTTTKTGGSNALTSILNNPIARTVAGAGAGALVGKLLGGNSTTGGKTTTGGTTGTGVRPSTSPNLPSMGGGQGVKLPGTGGTRPAGIPTTGGTSKVTPKSTPAGAAAAKTAKDDAEKKAEIEAQNPQMTDEEVQAELDRVKAEEEALGPPDDAVVAEDGTYTVTDAYGNISTYSADGKLIGYEGPEATTLTEGEDNGVTTRSLTGDTSTMADLGEGYFQDDSGNIYGSDGSLLYAVGENGEYYDPSGELIYDPNADTTAVDDTNQEDTTVADATSWTDPDTGEVWNMAADGSWSLEGDNTDYTDYTVADNSDNTDYTNSDEEPPEVKRGGSIHHNMKGGLPRFAEGDSVDYTDTTEEVQPWQNVDYNYGENDSPVLTGSNSLYSASGPATATYERSATASPSDFSPAPGIQYFDDGSYIQTFDDGSTITVDSDGNVTGTTDGYQTTVDDAGNTIVTDGYGNMTVYDQNGNVIPVGGGRVVGPVTSAGSGNRQSYESAVAAAQQRQQQNQPDQTGILDQLKNYITQNPGLAGGAIGALLSSLMSQASDSSSAGPSQPVDISALTAFAPRTTDFGPGMTGGRTGTGSPIVSYQDYAEDYGNETPDERLYADLGISGWLNEPEMTDYSVDDTETPQEDTTETAEEPTMAAGGPTTHYTFGRVIDPAQNLGIGQGMKKGGLSQAHTVHSHHTNPVIDDRVDFRRGSAVNGAGDGQSDDIPAWLADGEYVIDAELVSMLGNGSNKAGAKVLDKFREEVRNHKRSAPLNKIPPKAKSPLNYLKEAMNG